MFNFKISTKKITKWDDFTQFNLILDLNLVVSYKTFRFEVFFLTLQLVENLEFIEAPTHQGKTSTLQWEHTHTHSL